MSGDDLPLAANPYRGLEHTGSYREDKHDQAI